MMKEEINKTKIKNKEIGNKDEYEINFKNNFDKGFNDMKEMIRLIPLVELIINEDENLIYTIMRIEDLPDKKNEKLILKKK